VGSRRGLLARPGRAVNRAPATLDDTSPSGACIRLKTPIAMGARLTVKWHREDTFPQWPETAAAMEANSFSAFAASQPRGASNLPRRPMKAAVKAGAAIRRRTQTSASEFTWIDGSQSAPAPQNAPNQSRNPRVLPEPASAFTALVAHNAPSKQSQEAPTPRASRDHITAAQASPLLAKGRSCHREVSFPTSGAASMTAPTWPKKSTKTETPVNNLQPHPAESLTGSQSNLLAYDDIYHAAGIPAPRSGYGVHKVVDMLNSDRIRERSKDIKLASVLMALDAAGTSPDDLLNDATHRQQALNSYEAGQQKHLEEFGSPQSPRKIPRSRRKWTASPLTTLTHSAKPGRSCPRVKMPCAIGRWRSSARASAFLKSSNSASNGPLRRG
jgi:hypothetical protein